jgi:2-keto-4-pentenoate hydratase/2-oxohepta-3-ene-1,7-dioic acid hydratase in catechol pathway
MRLGRFLDQDNQIFYGIVKEDTIHLIDGNIFDRWEKTDRTIAAADVRFLAPVMPVNIFALGLNYKSHTAQCQQEIPSRPEFFLKATSCVTGHGSPILIPKWASSQVDYEAEMAIVIKKTARNITEKEAPDYILGYTCGNDVSARDCQLQDLQWSRGKSFETFGPLGPWIETDLDPGHCHLRCWVNDELRQDSITSMMIFPAAHIVSYLSRCTTLLPGTVIFSGTPSGCGGHINPQVWLKPGDVVKIEIEGIGILQNPVAEA